MPVRPKVTKIKPTPTGVKTKPPDDIETIKTKIPDDIETIKTKPPDDVETTN